jgi:hypothetical protein
MRKPRLLALVAGLVLALVGPAFPAAAHSGGKAELCMRAVKVEPAETDGNYKITVNLIDRDSGERMSGYAASVEGTSANGGRIEPTPLTALIGGIYTAPVAASPGDWTLTIRANGVPGVGEAVPLAVTQRISFTDKATTAGAGAAGDSGGDGGAAGAIVAVVAVLALGGVGAAFVMKRKAARMASASAS